MRPQYAYAAETRLSILSVSAVPRGEFESEGTAHFKYPDVESLDIVVRILLESAAEKKVTVFVSAFDQDGLRMGKAKAEKTVEPGESEIRIERFLLLENFYGEHEVKLNVEASAKSAATALSQRVFSFVGLPAPKAMVDYIEVRPRDEQYYIEFVPGEDFLFNFFFRIEENEGGMPLELKLYAVMDSQSFRLDDARLSDPFWGEIAMSSEPGFYQVEAVGSLPEKFADFYRERHYFRIIAVLDFDDEIKFSEPAQGLIFDERYGENREPMFEDETYVVLEEPERWRISELDRKSYERRIRDLKELKRVRRFDVYFGR
ncbi:MAG: hypothetical protein HRF49_11380 [bacterium]|jgi:hypothetical protein